MAETVTLSSNAADLVRRFEQLPPQMQEGIKRGLERGLILAESRVRTGTAIKARRGSAGLLGRLAHFVRRLPGVGLDAAIGFRKTRGFPYELSQEFGATAKPGKAMTIPLTKEAARYSSPRDFPRKLFVPRSNKRLLCEFIPRARQLHPQYVFVKRIKPRLRFRQNVVESLPGISDQISEGAGRAILGA